MRPRMGNKMGIQFLPSMPTQDFKGGATQMNNQNDRQGKYQVIYADPPWNFSSRQKNTGKGNISLDDYHYTTMSKRELFSLSTFINKISDDNCILFIWTTDAHLSTCIELIKEWGFSYKTIGFNWLKKEKSGKQVCFMGTWTMKGSELCLLATKGKTHNLLKNRKIRQLVEAPRLKHSEKPEKVRDNINKMFPTCNKLELFARKKTSGWDAWGNEVESDIKL